MGADSRVTYSDCNAMSDSNLKLFTDKNLSIMGGVAGFAEHAVAFNVFINSLEDNEKQEMTQDTEGISKLFHDFTSFAEDRKIMISEKDNILGHFMIASQKGAWCAEGLYIKQIDDYEVIGCGETSARPIMYIGESMHKALDSACSFNIHCSYPLVFSSIEITTGETKRKIIEYPTGTYIRDEDIWE